MLQLPRTIGIRRLKLETDTSSWYPEGTFNSYYVSRHRWASFTTRPWHFHCGFHPPLFWEFSVSIFAWDGVDQECTASDDYGSFKGKPMRLDVSSVTIGDQRIFSYMSQAIGLVADADLGMSILHSILLHIPTRVSLGTENLRWMGDIRFVLGYVAGGS